MLWGAHAQKKAALIDPQRHLLLQAPHPSPLSAHRGFLQCGHFAQANAHLQRQGLPLESVAVSILMTKAITTKTTGFGGAVSGARTV